MWKRSPNFLPMRATLMTPSTRERSPVVSARSGWPTKPTPNLQSGALPLQSRGSIDTVRARARKHARPRWGATASTKGRVSRMHHLHRQAGRTGPPRLATKRKQYRQDFLDGVAQRADEAALYLKCGGDERPVSLRLSVESQPRVWHA